MTEAISAIPIGTYDLATAAHEYLQAEIEQQRLEQIDTNWKYYHGYHKQPLSVRYGQPDDNVILNIARLIVDKGASFLFGKELQWELQEGETTPEEEELERIWQRNRKMTFLSRIAVAGGVTGHVFIKTVPDQTHGEPPRLVSVESEYVRVSHSAEDIEDVWRYRIEWPERDRQGRTVYRRQDIERDDNGRWQVMHRVAVGNNQFKPDPAHPDLFWNFPWPPMIDCQNLINPGTFYGLSDLEDLSEQDAINYLASKIQRIIRYHAQPRAVGAGFRPEDVNQKTDDMLILPTTESWLKLLEMTSDLSPHLGYLDRLINWFLAGARIPRLDPAQINVGALSGFALKVLYGDLLEKTEVKRRTYGDMLTELNRRLLELAGHGPDNIVTTHWADPLPEDEKAEKERDQFELDYDVTSVETVRSRRGIDHDTETERIRAQEAEGGNIGALLLRNFETGSEE